MSAYIVDKKLIDYILTAKRNAQPFINYYDFLADADGQVLINQNYDSVNYRYNEETPAPVYKFASSEERINFLQAIKYLHCLDYQSCETPTYKESKAYKLINDMLWLFSRCISGFENLKWDYN
jgi:hypothetical protein